ncbi:MAG: Macrolide export protein MacA [Actinobacteria bacterium ADurb.Bin346]|nr:MAG: Macrolide export protein MacA [Actinobacteria bacterium ADurb.Bin346]
MEMTKNEKTEKRIKKHFISVFLLIMSAALLIASGLSGCSKSPMTQIESFTVARGDIVESITSTGSVDASQSKNYSLTQSAEVLEIIDKGKEFSKGDILIRIDDSKIKLYISQAEANLKLAEKSIELAKINYQAALDANHVAVQLVQSNNDLAETAVSNAFKAMEDANILADASVSAANNAVESSRQYLDKINSSPFSTDVLKAQAESSLSAAENSYEQAKESARAQSDSAEGAYNQSLANQSVTYWSGINSLETAKNQIKLMNKNIEQAEIQYELSKINLDLVRLDSDKFAIRAPFDGIVANANFSEGETAGPGVAAISILSRTLVIKSDINEMDIAKCSIGQEAELTFDAYPDRSFKGRIVEISPLPKNIAGIISYEIKVEPEKEVLEYLRYGLSANLTIIISSVKDVLYIPLQSVYTENGKSYVDRLIGGSKTEKVEITTGNYNYDYIEVKSGLSEGDVVVISISNLSGSNNRS